MQARDSAVYRRSGQVVQIALPLEAAPKFTPITPVLDGCELDSPLQLPTDTVKSVMGVEARLAQLEAERSRIVAEGAVAQKGVWIEGFTTVRHRKSGKQVRYEYFSAPGTRRRSASKSGIWVLQRTRGICRRGRRFGDGIGWRR
jgi:hypothetical protein